MKEKKNKKNKKGSKKEDIKLENEIIIGLTPKKEEIKTSNKKDKKKNEKKVNKAGKAKTNPKKEKERQEKEKKKQEKEKQKQIIKQQKLKKAIKKKPKQKEKRKIKFNLNVIKWTSLVVLAILLIVLLLRSSLFNIREIKVENNNIVSSEKIIKLSNLTVNSNMFKFTKRSVLNGLKTNAYIEDAKIKRGITGVITIIVKERKPTYMLKFANSYVYINNQGYMLELSEEPLEIPTITGFETPVEQIKEGNRLEVKDLQKLEDVIKIMNSASEMPIGKLITKFDIEDKDNYKIELESENKIVQFGTATNISVKLLKIQEVLQKEEGVQGEIYFQDSERTVFKETV